MGRTASSPRPSSMTKMDNTMEKLEEYLTAMEEYVFSSISAAAPEHFRDSLNQLWVDITRYGPTMPSIHDVTARIPGLGDFEIPPPPPPLPPKGFVGNCYDWAERHPWITGSAVVGLVGTGLFVGYGGIYMKARRATILRNKAESNERRRVIVVLGGDTPLGFPLVLDLERKGYIVIASVAASEAVSALESKCHGYVRALALDPGKPDTVPAFLKSLASTLSRRFPITAAGDPYASPAAHPYIHSVVSLLTLPPPSLHAPLEHISLPHNYLPYITTTQIIPLQIIQSLLPLLRNAHVPNHRSDKKSIVVCLPATETHLGLPFSAIQSMTAVSTLRAIEILRREIDVASITGKSETMQNIRVVGVNVGSFDLGGITSSSSPQDVYKAMEKWTASEKITYGPAFVNVMAQAHSTSASVAMSRKPTDVGVFVDAIVGVVSNGKYGHGPLVQRLGLERLVNWLRGDRVSVGAGAETYRVASSLLPSLILDALLNLPALLMSIRNGLITTQPFLRPPRLVPGRRSTSASTPAPPRDISLTSSGSTNPASSASITTEGQNTSSSGESSEVSEVEGSRESLVESWIDLPKEAEIGHAT